MSLAVSLIALVIAAAALALAWRTSRPDTAQESAEADQPVPEDLTDLPALRSEVAALKLDVASSLRNIAVVRYDAFDDMGGHLSWSVALLDESGAGVLLTSIHGRQDTRSYAKAVRDWTTEVALSPEEEQALQRAQPS